ncbi:MAG: hypothetical protein ACYDEB_10160 [Dehalococcoidia bacterium]
MKAWNSAEQAALAGIDTASARVAARVPAARTSPNNRCDGPFVVHQDGRVACTGICIRGKSWERVPFLGWDHLKARKVRCGLELTAGSECDRCRDPERVVDARAAHRSQAGQSRQWGQRSDRPQSRRSPPAGDAAG